MTDVEIAMFQNAHLSTHYLEKCLLEISPMCKDKQLPLNQCYTSVHHSLSLLCPALLSPIQ